LRENQLTGSIPAEFSALVNLEALYMDRNALTGSIPIDIGKMNKLKYLFTRIYCLGQFLPWQA